MSEVTEPPPCRLLALPRELRDIIYEYTFSTEVDPFERTPSSLNAGLLLTCKQIQDETRLLYFANTTFSFIGLYELSSWLADLQADVLAALSHLVVKFQTPKPHYTQSVLELYKQSKRKQVVKRAIEMGMAEPEKVLEARLVSEIPEGRPRYGRWFGVWD